MKRLLITASVIFAFGVGATALADPPVVSVTGNTIVGHEGNGRITTDDFTGTKASTPGSLIGVDPSGDTDLTTPGVPAKMDLPDAAGNATEGNDAGGPGVDNHFSP